MTEINASIAKKSIGGIQWISILAAVMFCYIIFDTLGISFETTAEIAEKSYEIAQAGVQNRAGGRSLAEIAPLLGFGFLAIFIQWYNRSDATGTWTRAFPLVFVLSLCLLSALWSAFPDIAWRRGIRHLIYMMIVAGTVVGTAALPNIHRLAILVTGLIMAMNFASVVMLPGVAVDDYGNLTGLLKHKNIAGGFAMIAVFSWLSAALWWDGGRKRFFLYLGALLWFAFLIGTNSRTSLAATVLAIALVVPLRFFVRNQLSLILAVLGAIFFALISIFVLNLFNVQMSDIFAPMEGEKTTLTGRTEIWRIAYQAFLENILLGVGYGSLWATGGVAVAETFGSAQATYFLITLNQAHNGYVDILAQLGMIGALAFAFFLAHAATRAIKALISVKPATAELAFAGFCGFVFVGGLIHNLAETTFLRGNTPWFFFVICYLSLCSPRWGGTRESAQA
jgi:O-antigen ligase